jgi:hypothetical protein
LRQVVAKWKKDIRTAEYAEYAEKELRQKFLIADLLPDATTANFQPPRCSRRREEVQWWCFSAPNSLPSTINKTLNLPRWGQPTVSFHRLPQVTTAYRTPSANLPGTFCTPTEKGLFDFWRQQSSAGHAEKMILASVAFYRLPQVTAGFRNRARAGRLPKATEVWGGRAGRLRKVF